jgi:nitroimidazol reductase NimA-like FMN-containing flavoprotein (pyridoxamine 5'-phosphate oxidase superfamily)
MTDHTSNKEKMRAHALEFIKSHHTMVLSTVSSSGQPHAATMYYVADDDFNLYFITVSTSKKAENLRANSSTAFVIGAGPEIVTVQGGGSAVPLDEHQALVFYGLIENIALKSPWQWPLLMLTKGKNTLFSTFRITPTRMTLFNLDKEKYPDIASEEFHTII